MSKYDRDIQDVYAVKQLGDEIGYGHLMALAHELWARHLEEKGLPRKGAHCAVGYSAIKDEYQSDAMNDPIYKVIVERVLADTPQTERSDDAIVKMIPIKIRNLHGLREYAKILIAFFISFGF